MSLHKLITSFWIGFSDIEASPSPMCLILFKEAATVLFVPHIVSVSTCEHSLVDDFHARLQSFFLYFAFSFTALLSLWLGRDHFPLLHEMSLRETLRNPITSPSIPSPVFLSFLSAIVAALSTPFPSHIPTLQLHLLLHLRVLRHYLR